MNKIIITLLVFVIISCENSTQNESRDPLQKKDGLVTNSEILDSKIMRDTLFADYYYQMPLEELKDKNEAYFFIKGNDSIDFNIQYKLTQNRLDTLVLKKDWNIKESDFDFLLKIYKNKYGKFKKFTKNEKKFYKKKFNVKHIYWNNQDKDKFRYSKRSIHSNGYKKLGKFYQEGCLFSGRYNNAEQLNGKEGYHMHAIDKETNEKWVFEVDLNNLKKEYATYTNNYASIVDGNKLIELEVFRLKNPKKYVRREKLSRKRYQPREIKLNYNIDKPKSIPLDFIQIRYSKLGDNKESTSPKNLDSLRNVKKNENRKDI